jgi:hypothetical protein
LVTNRTADTASLFPHHAEWCHTGTAAVQRLRGQCNFLIAFFFNRAIDAKMPKRSQRWVHLDGLRHLRYLSIVLDDADDDGGWPMLELDDLKKALEVAQQQELRFNEYRMMPDLIDLSCVVELTRWNHRAPYRAQLSDQLCQRAITDRMLQAWCHMNRTS